MDGSDRRLWLVRLKRGSNNIMCACGGVSLSGWGDHPGLACSFCSWLYKNFLPDSLFPGLIRIISLFCDCCVSIWAWTKCLYPYRG